MRNSWSRSGVLRMTSTYPAAARFTSQFDESRATPTMTPRIVARMIPTKLTNRVLSRPTTNACP
jgi:hypothetical protein